MGDEGAWAWSFAGAPPSDEEPAPERRDGPDVKAGDVIAGRFELEALLGRGGAGAVWRAHETGTERGVALKLLESTLDAGQRARFAREGELTAALQHPGIVRIHAAGEHEGRPWIAYELVAGGVTAEHALRGLDRRGRLQLLRDVARAVGHAHARGIVHRDLKPQNVLVDLHGRARVADFGLARLHGAARLTGTGALVGTPLFMAPEQFTPDHPVGPQTDVWALGVMLYEALTGALPFQAPSLLALGARIVQGSPAPPRERDPSISPDLEALVLAALAADPDDRPADGEALAADLDAVLAGRAPRAGRRLLSARGRRRALGALAALVAAAPVVVVTVASRTAPAVGPAERAPPTPAAALAAAEGLLRGAPTDPAAWRAATRARLTLGQADQAWRELERLTVKAAWVERLRADVEEARGLDPAPRLLRAAVTWPDDPDLLEPLLERELALGRAREVAARLAGLPLSLQADPRLSPVGAAARALAAPDGAALRACGPALAEHGARWLVRRARRDVALLARPPEPRPPSAIGPMGPAPDRLPATERAARARAALAAALAAAPDGRAAAQAWAVRAELEGPGAPGARPGTSAADEAVLRLAALAGPPGATAIAGGDLAPWLAGALRAQARGALAAQRPLPGLAAATRALLLVADERAAGAGAERVQAGQAEAWTLAGEALLALGRPDDAAAALERAGGAASLDPRTVATLASVRAAQGRGGEVTALEERAARLRGARKDEAEELVHRARHVMKREPTDQRAALYAQALELDPRNANARYQVGFLALKEQEFIAGFRAMVPAVRDAPWLRSREVVEAMEELGKIGRDVTGGRSPLGPLMAELGPAGSARDRVVRGFVGHALAEYELQRGWLEPSLLDLRLHLEDDPGDVHALAIVGFLELRAGHPAEAEEALDVALEAAPEVGTFHFYRALIQAARGASTDVVGRELQRAVSLGHPALYDLRPYPELTARRSDVAAAQRAGLLLPGTAPR